MTPDTEQLRDQILQGYSPGSQVMVKLSGKKAIILQELAPDPDERQLGRKYLIRTEEHKKMQVHDCEIKPFSMGANAG